jgi:hypothetical protein
VLFFFVLPALAEPVDNIYGVQGPQDAVFARGKGDELGEGVGFQTDERIETVGVWNFLDPTACAEGYDDPAIVNPVVLIVNNTGRTISSLWYVGDTHFAATGGGLIYDTTLSNYDGYIGNAGLKDAGYAFKIDNLGVNKSLWSESISPLNNLFEPGEVWYFIIQDYVNIYQGPAAPFDSIGIASLSGGYPVASTGSLVADIPDVPEPATIAMLGLGALSLLRRKRSA